MENRSPLLPVDRWVAFANLVFLTSWLPLASRLPLAAWFCLVHIVGLTLPWLLSRAGSRLSPPGAVLRELYPLLWTAAFWSELAFHTEAFAAPVNEVVVAGWDMALFGGHPNLTWLPAMPWPPLSELMQAVYFSYYILLLLIPLALLRSPALELRREVILRVAVGYLACFFVYSFFPVVGPRDLWPVFQGEHTRGFFYQLNLSLRSSGNSPGTAFPSSHTAGALTFAWIAWRLVPGVRAIAVSVLAGLIALATVYNQMHFAVDTIAGIAVAVVTQAIVVPALLGRSPARAEQTGEAARAAPRVLPEAA